MVRNKNKSFIILILIAFAHCSLKKVEKSKDNPIQKIYSFILDIDLKNEIGLDSIPVCESTVTKYKDCVFPAYLSDTTISAGMTQACVNFLEKNKVPLSTNFEKSPKHPLINEDYASLNKKRMVRFSNVGFSKDKKTAIVFVELTSPFLEGFGAYYLLKIQDKITIVKKKYAWAG